MEPKRRFFVPKTTKIGNEKQKFLTMKELWENIKFKL